MMTPSKLVRVAIGTTVSILVASCSSSLNSPKHDSGTDVPIEPARDSGRDTAADGPITLPHDSGADVAHGGKGCTGHAPAPGEVPPAHRATTVCPPTAFFLPDSGGSCTVSSDCPIVPLGVLSNCLHGQCSPDQCLTDADCQPNEVCACNNGAGPGGAGAHRNACVPAQCHVDADCGVNGYCSPSIGYCGGIGGYFCHGPNDGCVDGAKDCACGQTCQYLPTTTSGFRCAPAPVCAG